MTDIKTYIKDGLRNIKKLQKAGELTSANSACDELLKFDPYNQKVLKMKEEIEEAILENNLEKVKQRSKEPSRFGKQDVWKNSFKSTTSSTNMHRSTKG